MLDRENYLRNARLQGPAWIPSAIVISGASWQEHKRDMEDVVLRHPDVFSMYDSEGVNWASLEAEIVEGQGQSFVDAWGCTWKRGIGGLEGIVVDYPMADWEALASYRPPDPLLQGDRGPANWAEVEEGIRRRRERGELTAGGPPHGFFFLRLTYLRGFDNFMVDLASEAEGLPRLIEMLMVHNRALIEKWLSLGVDVIELADDLGTQQSSIVSPSTFRRWLKPHYRELAMLCRQAGRLVALHSDGYIMDLMDEFLAVGIDIINPQDLVNGIDDLAREVKGRMCIRLDIDRQRITPYGTQAEIRELIEEEVRKLGDPKGGLEFIAGIYPPTTPDRVDALASALEEFRTYWWDGRGR